MQFEVETAEKRNQGGFHNSRKNSSQNPRFCHQKILIYEVAAA